jgi:hypothetical protein
MLTGTSTINRSPGRRGRLANALPTSHPRPGAAASNSWYMKSLPSNPPPSNFTQATKSHPAKKAEKKKNGVPAKVLAAHFELSDFIGDSNFVDSSAKDEKDEDDDDMEILEARENQDLRLGASMSDGARRMREWRLKSKQQRGGARRTYKSGGRDKPMATAFRPATELKHGIESSLPHIVAAQKVQDLSAMQGEHQHTGWVSCYSSLPVRLKLDMLQFLVEEMIHLDTVVAELTKRYHVTHCYSPRQFLPLPGKEELKDLCNVDDCVVCMFPGDLICCDGCTNSFHKRCCRYVEQVNLGLRQLGEDTWLCPECTIADPSKLGPLHGGNKPAITWWGSDDFFTIIQNAKLEVSKLGEELMQAQNEAFHRAQHPPEPAPVPIAGPFALPPPLPPTQPRTQPPTMNPEQQLAAAEELKQRYEVIQNSYLEPNIEYLIIHGLVFRRQVRHEGSSYKLEEVVETARPMMPVTQGELHTILARLGPLVCTQWPWCQVPMNPAELWTELIQSSTAPKSIAASLKTLKSKQASYFASPGFYNPTMYSNLYCKAPPPMQFLRYQQLPKQLYQKTPTGQYVVANFELLVSACEAVGVLDGPGMFRRCLPLPELPSLTYDVKRDTSFFSEDKLQGNGSPLDLLAPVKSYLRSLERMLSKACLMHEHWGIDWTNCRHPRVDQLFEFHDAQRASNRSKWYTRLREAKTANQVGKCAVLLVDSIDTRAFYDEWTFLPQKWTPIINQDEDVSGVRTYFDIPPETTAKQLIEQRKQERSSRLRGTRRSLLVDSVKTTESDGKRIASIGRKGRQSQHRQLAQQALPSISSTTLKSLHTPGHLTLGGTEGVSEVRLLALPKKKASSAKKVNVLKSTLGASAERLYLKCVHCQRIVSTGVRLSSPKHATRDHYEHIQACEKCPREVKALVSALRSKGEVSADSGTFFTTLVSRMKDLVQSRSSEAPASDAPNAQDTTSTSSVTTDYVPASKVLVNPDGIVSASLPATNTQTNGTEDVKSMLLPKTENAGAPNGSLHKDVVKKEALDTKIADISGMKKVGPPLNIPSRSLVKAEVPVSSVPETVPITAQAKSEERSTPKDQLEESNAYEFQPGTYPLVDPSDQKVVSKYIMSVYKHYTPVKDCPPGASLAVRKVSANIGRPKKGTKKYKRPASLSNSTSSGPPGKKPRSDLQRYYVGCLYCGEIPSFGIKVGGPQHATKDLFYHVQECPYCPTEVKSCITKARTTGIRSQNSGAFFKSHLAKLKHYTDARSTTDMKVAFETAVKQRRSNLTQDLTNLDAFASFKDSSSGYALIQEEDLMSGSPFFIMLYKSFIPVGRNFGNTDKELSLEISLHISRLMRWVGTGEGGEHVPVFSANTVTAPKEQESFHPDASRSMDVAPHAPGETSGGTGQNKKANITNEAKHDAIGGTEPSLDVDGKDSAPVQSEHAPLVSAVTSSTSDPPVAANQVKIESENTANGNRRSISHPTVATNQAIEASGTAPDVFSRPPSLKAQHDKEEKDHRTQDAISASMSATKLKMDENMVHQDTPAIRQSSGLDSASKHVIEAPNMESAEKKKKSKKVKTPKPKKVRRSGRVKNPVVDEFAVSPFDSSLTPAESAKKASRIRNTEGGVEQKERMAELEKLVSEPFTKEIHWPICGRLFIPPPGSFSPNVMRYIGRKGGCCAAPFALYSNKLEVGKPSQRFCWRTDMVDVETVEEVYMQIHILDSYLNRPVSLFLVHVAHARLSYVFVVLTHFFAHGHSLPLR